MANSLLNCIDKTIDLLDNCNNSNGSKKISHNYNCLFDLETEARKILCDLISKAIKSIYNKDLDEKECQDCICSQFCRPKHGRGEITLPCFKLCKLLKSSPKQIAEQITKSLAKTIETNTTNTFLKVEASNGRINVHLTAKYIGQIMQLILKENNSYLSALPAKHVRVMVEYSQPNTHKAFHVGHMRNVALGDCLVRLYEHCGYETVAANYFGDEGAHVAKCLWLLQKQIDEEKLDLNEIEKNINNKGEWLGNKYANASLKLSLSTYTRFPYIGVIAAKILSIHKHPNDKKWNVIKVKHVNQQESIVVCGANVFDNMIGKLVGYIPVGTKWNDKLITNKNMKGIQSEGMIMSEMELGLNNNNNKIYVIDKCYPNAQIGDELTEIGKFEEYKNVDNVVRLWQQYTNESKQVLKELESGNKKWVDLWTITRKWSLDEFHEIYKWLDARFDYDFCESDCSEESRTLVEEYYNKGIFVESEGAIGIHLNEENLGFCMLLKSNGCGLYATKDLILARKKFELFNIDESIYVVDCTQSHHFKQVFATLNRMGYKQSSKCYHLSYSFVRLPKGKMASRSGNIILFTQLKQLLSNEINKQFLDPLRNNNHCLKEEEEEEIWSENELQEAERAISVGAIRYGMLNHDNNKEIIFDLQKWTLSSGNTGPYLMYQYARISSIARKVKCSSNINIDYCTFLQNDKEAKYLLFQISHFQKKVEKVCQDKNPSQLCDYLYSICKLFSQWYCKPQNSIKKCHDNQLKAVRLQFIKCVAQTVKVGIQLLGITPLQRM